MAIEMAEHVIAFDESGNMQFVYSDELLDLLDEGDATVTRVSHVEPTSDNRWTADMTPVRGPILGPFKTHAKALAAERMWLREQVGL